MAFPAGERAGSAAIEGARSGGGRDHWEDRREGRGVRVDRENQSYGLFKINT